MPEIELHYLGKAWQIGDSADPSVIIAKAEAGAPQPRYDGSLTALGTALMRAAHTRLDPSPLIDDSWGDRLVPKLARAAFRDTAVFKAGQDARAAMTPDAILDASFLSASGYTNVIVRGRYAEDALRDAVERGVRQYVIIGAGFDSFGLRRPAFADQLQIIEIDEPATQALKRERIRECGLTVSASLHFVAADLAREDLAAVLARSAYRPELPTFFAWLGVTMFLTRDANLATLRALAGCSARGSELVFTYFDQRAFETTSAAFLDLQESARIAGEPFQSGFDSSRLAEVLGQCGLELLENLSEAQLVARLSRSETNRLTPLEHSHVARARVV
jgi:methyltransferase (TIGR00027 family)